MSYLSNILSHTSTYAYPLGPKYANYNLIAGFCELPVYFAGLWAFG
jgi:hypothetical protein